MRVLVFDTEHTEGIFHPWEEGFILSCLRYTTGINCDTTLWFDHENINDPLGYSKEEAWVEFQRVVKWADIIVGHNLKHDIKIAQYCGNISFEGKQLWDTQVVEYLLSGQDPQRGFGLDEVADHYKLGRKKTSAKEYWDHGVHTYEIPWDVLDDYVSQDVNLTEQIFTIQEYETRNTRIRKVIELQNEFIFSLVDMEMNGLKIDVEKGEQLFTSSKEKVVKIEKELKQIFGDERLNFQSNDHLSSCLYGGTCTITWKEWVTKTLKGKPETKYYEKKFEEQITLPRIFDPLPRTELKKKGYYKTDKDTINQLKAKGKLSRRIKNLLNELSVESKTMETLRGKTEDSGLLNKIASDGCVHTFFNNAFTSTGRLSSSRPNLMNMAREGTAPIKQVVASHLDGIMQWDLSQVEWRVAAYLSQDRVMMDEIIRGVDQHIAACVDLMELPFVCKEDPDSKLNRFHAKVFNFRMIYGGSYWGFYLDPNMPRFTKKKWRRICEDFYKKYNGLEAWQKRGIQSTWSNNGLLEIPTGRRFQFHKTEYSDGAWTYPENKIKNYPVQGMSGADILPLACCLIRRWMKAMGLKSKLILTVHDSIVFSYAQDEVETLVEFLKGLSKHLSVHVSNYFDIDFNVPLDGEIEIGPTYGELH